MLPPISAHPVMIPDNRMLAEHAFYFFLFSYTPQQISSILPMLRELLRNHARVAAQHIAFCEILQERGQLRTL